MAEIDERTKDKVGVRKYISYLLTFTWFVTWQSTDTDAVASTTDSS